MADDPESLRLNLEYAEAWMRRGDSAAAGDYEQATDLNPALRALIGARMDEARRKAAEGTDF